MMNVLVVDDKEMMRDSVGATLQRAGFGVLSAIDGPSALAQVSRKRPDAVVSDLKMPGMTGVELLAQIREIDDDLPVILMTAFGDVSSAVEAMKLGAFDYLTKPFEGDELLIAVKRAIEHARVVKENAVLRLESPCREGPAAGDGSARPHGLDRIVGQSETVRSLRDQVRAVAASHGTVLVTGESGAGKEVVARAIHETSPRVSGPFLALNCAALSESLLESELFGHERGAFTGAEKLRKGRFELADGGTLLLDEISEVSPQIQAKLLRVLQERAFERVGSSVTIGVDVRVIATSNRDLPGAVARGEFRQDLFFRLNVLPVNVPPLRARLEDVPDLARHFVARIAEREGRAGVELTGDAMDLMSSYQWPGNVRELQNICERAVVLGACAGPGSVGVVTRGLIEPWLAVSMPARELVNGSMNGTLNGSMTEPKLGVVPNAPHGLVMVDGRSLEDIERDAVVCTLHRFNGHRQKTATSLGIGVRTLGLKLKKWKEMQLVEAGL